jgi:hypothetical protein
MCDKKEVCCEGKLPMATEYKRPNYKVGGVIDEKFYNEEYGLYVVGGVLNDDKVILSKNKYIEFETENLYRVYSAIECKMLNFVAIVKLS